MYHIIQTDNYGGDYPNESFLSRETRSETDLSWTKDEHEAAVYATEEGANNFAAKINDRWGDFHLRYCRVVKAGYKLKPGFEP